MFDENFNAESINVNDVIPQVQLTKSEKAKLAKREKAQVLKNTVDQFISTGNDLADKYDKSVKQSKHSLYQLLSEIMAFSETVLPYPDKDKKEIVKALRQELHYTYKIKTQKNSPNLTIIVRYVTRTDRKNALIYGRVLEVAFAKKITSAEFVDFIEQQGGINNVLSLQERQKNRSNRVIDIENSTLSHKKACLVTKFWLQDIAKENALAKFTIDTSRESEMQDATKTANFAYMICERRGNEFTVIDAIGAVDKNLEAFMFEKYFNYKFALLSKKLGDGQAKNEMFDQYRQNIKFINETRVSKDMRALEEEEILQTFIWG